MACTLISNVRALRITRKQRVETRWPQFDTNDRIPTRPLRSELPKESQMMGHNGPSGERSAIIDG
jgi:hypothetical protein